MVVYRQPYKWPFRLSISSNTVPRRFHDASDDIFLEASVTEVFYGIARDSHHGLLLLTIFSLLELVILPEIKNRCINRKGKIKLAFGLYEGMNVLCKLRYLYGLGDSFGVLPWAFGIRYQRNPTSVSMVPFESWVGTGLFLLRFVTWWKEQQGDHESAVLPDTLPVPAKSDLEAGGKCAKCAKPFHQPVCTQEGIVYCKQCLPHDIQYRNLFLE